jgi:hypothetical protein
MNATATATAVDTYAIATALTTLQAEVRRRRWLNDPVLWVQERLGETLWSRQRDILRAIRTHRKVAVHSCHNVGKSFIAARAVCWWIDVHLPGEAFVVTSAPTAPQVRAILWREIGRAHAHGSLPGRLNLTEWYMTVRGREELVAFGRKPSDYEPTAFQGIHAPYVLYVFDEACGMPAALWEAADSLIANDASKALAIGNPDDPQSEFARICRPGSGWHVECIGAFDSPNFTGEDVPPDLAAQLIGHTYVEEKRRRWAPSWSWDEARRRVLPPPGGEDSANPLWYSKVLGVFPAKQDAGALIPLPWLAAARQRTPAPVGQVVLGVDVGRGGDASTICLRQGTAFRIIHEDHNPDTMQTCGAVVDAYARYNAASVRVDEIGVGAGIVDRGREQGLPFVGVNVGEAARDAAHFANLRAELYWHLRSLFEHGLIALPADDDDTAAELAELRYRRLSNGKIQIESKESMLRRGVRSPNRAEALMLAAAPEELLTSRTATAPNALADVVAW